MKKKKLLVIISVLSILAVSAWFLLISPLKINSSGYRLIPNVLSNYNNVDEYLQVYPIDEPSADYYYVNTENPFPSENLNEYYSIVLDLQCTNCGILPISKMYSNIEFENGWPDITMVELNTISPTVISAFHKDTKKYMISFLVHGDIESAEEVIQNIRSGKLSIVYQTALKKCNKTIDLSDYSYSVTIQED